MAYLFLVYLIFLCLFVVFSYIGIYYLKASGRGSVFSKKMIKLYQYLAIIIIALSLLALVIEFSV